MPNPTSPSAFPDARAALNRAVQSARGIRLRFPTEAAAIAFRFRCYTVRKRDRDTMLKVHPELADGGIISQFDGLQFNITPGLKMVPAESGFFLYIINADGAEALVDIEEL